MYYKDKVTSGRITIGLTQFNVYLIYKTEWHSIAGPNVNAVVGKGTLSSAPAKDGTDKHHYYIREDYDKIDSFVTNNYIIGFR